jgi:isoleucyl-tRNA synthetase
MGKKYPEYKHLNLPLIADQVLQQWQDRQIFERSISEREGQPGFTFYEGPPSANGLPGIHHVMARSIKDIFCRYKTQKGFQVKRKGGWDTHGLPIEISVEKTLGITKEDIGNVLAYKLGIPSNIINENEIEKLKRLENTLSQDII